jgi:hypothetical protein
MRLRVLPVLVAVVSSVAVLAGTASAKTVKIGSHSPSAVKKACRGGVFWPADGTSHTYGCLNADGSGIVRSGVTADQKKTCATWAVAPAGSPYAHQLKIALARAAH